ncbi:MAG: hypothetical protein WC748_09150 [Legionellales bacterium]|jgi:hypothetical protein
MTFKNISPEHIFAKSNELQNKINEYYDRAVDVLQGINRYVAAQSPNNAKKIPIPHLMFHLYSREVNDLLAELAANFDEIIDLTHTAIQEAWESSNPEKFSPEVRDAVVKGLADLEKLKNLNYEPNPIDEILSSDGQLPVSMMQWQSPIPNLMAHIYEVLSTTEQAIADAENPTSNAKSDTNFLQVLQSALAPLRQAGLLKRNFMTDLAPVIRLQVKQTYQSIEKDTKSKGQRESQYWAEDVMNALTVHIINVRDGRVLETQAQASFNSLIKLVLNIANLALKPLIWRQKEWLEYIAQLQTDILALDVSEEVKADLTLAIKRIEKGACADKAAIQACITQLYQKIHDGGWFSPSFVDIWIDARKRLLQVQRHLFQAIKKRRDDLENVLIQISTAHENAFKQNLFVDIPDGSVKQWLIIKQSELDSILKSKKPKLLSSQSIEDWEQKYRQFWLNFSQSLDKQCFNTAWHQRTAFEQARRNAAKARDDLSSPECGEMLFSFGEVDKVALLNLLEYMWNKTYNFTVIAQDSERDRVYKVLRGQLAGSRSTLEAVHYLNAAMLSMQMSHAKNSLAHHIWGKPSRGTTVLAEVVVKAQELAILPKTESLAFSNVIFCIMSSMQSYFSRLFFRKPEQQADVARILNTVVREREKMMLTKNEYSQEQAENTIMKQIKGLYESLEAEYASRPLVRLTRFFGGDCRSDYIDSWKRVYTRLKDEHQLNAFHVEVRPEILLRLEISILKIKKISGIKNFYPGFSDERDRVTSLLNSLKRVIQEQCYDSISVANEFNRVLVGLEDRDQFFYSDFSQIFKSCYDDLKSRGLLVFIEPRTLLEEEMGKSMNDIREESQRYKRAAAIMTVRAEATFKKIKK